MRKTICTLAAALLFLSGSAWSAKVTDVELTFSDGFTRARLAVDGEVEYSHQTVEARDGKPFRVILDLKNAVHDLPGKAFTELPSCPITTIRSSQFAADPVPVVRLVFDMRRPSIYRVDVQKGYLTVFFADNAGKEFPIWTATGNPLPRPVSTPKASPKEKYFAFAATDNNDKAASSRAAASTPANKSADKSAKSAEELNKASRQDRLSSLSPARSEPTPKTVDSKQNPTANASLPFYGPPVDMSLVPITTKQAAKPETPLEATTLAVNKPANDTKLPAAAPKSQQKQFAGSSSDQPTDAKMARQKAADRKSAESNSPTGKPSAQQSVVKPHVGKSDQDQTVPANKPSAADQTVNVAGAGKKPVVSDKPTDKKPTLATETKPQTTPPKPLVKPGETFGPSVDMALVPRTAKPQPKMAVESPDRSADATIRPSRELAAVDKPAKADDKPAAVSADKTPVTPASSESQDSRTTDSAVDKSDKSSQDRKSTSRFRRNPVLSRKMKGTLVAEFPKRLVVKYRAQAHRDPFETLINESRTHNNPVEQRIANVDGLRLVGVIEADDGANRALFEDKEGYGYILKTGDKVLNGYVLRVEPNRVYFQIFEYGWSRTVALKLDEF
jgi:hypothetical protein